MRTESSISLDVGGDHFHILCDDADALARVADMSRHWHAPPAALPGFQVSPPAESKRLWVLLGSNGAVLARSTERDDVLACLERHLHTLASEQPAESNRFGLSSVVGPAGVVLVHPDLFRYQPFIERRWDQAGVAIVDSTFAQLQLDPTPIAVPAGQRAIEADAPNHTQGHVDLSNVSGHVRGLLWTGHHDAPAATHAQIVHALATSALGGDHDERMRIAHHWAPHLAVDLVPAFERKTLLSAAAKLVGTSS